MIPRLSSRFQISAPESLIASSSRISIAAICDLPGRALRALRPVVAAAVGLVDRVDPLLLGRDLVAPAGDIAWAGWRPSGPSCARLRAGWSL